MLRNERRWLALGERGRKRARVVRRARARAAVRGALPAPLPAVPKLKQSSREHYAHTQSFDVANTPYEELPDFCPPTSTLDKINHPRPLRAEWKGIPLDLSNDPHVGELHPAEVYLASQLRLPAMCFGSYINGGLGFLGLGFVHGMFLVGLMRINEMRINEAGWMCNWVAVGWGRMSEYTGGFWVILFGEVCAVMARYPGTGNGLNQQRCLFEFIGVHGFDFVEAVLRQFWDSFGVLGLGC
ncbi:unnamed protein product [Pneumocystis jirovecii]|uniref:Uncharacterized protein n=1 Tax=Pneumocystis jirovecii TaxID=42068 RepID=L0PCU2_PNEJI|nr:unnamed protein product [Pneumocystis jirovecii]